MMKKNYGTFVSYVLCYNGDTTNFSEKVTKEINALLCNDYLLSRSSVVNLLLRKFINCLSNTTFSILFYQILVSYYGGKQGNLKKHVQKNTSFQLEKIASFTFSNS